MLGISQKKSTKNVFPVQNEMFLTRNSLQKFKCLATMPCKRRVMEATADDGQAIITS